MSKYNAVPIVVDGIRFASKGEAKRYKELALLEKARKISNLTLQPEFELLDAFTDNQGRRHRAIKYRADFQYIEDKKWIVEDYKGVQTPAFKLKMKMFLKNYPEFIFRITN